MTTLEITLAGIIAVMVLCFGGFLYAHHEGAVQCVEAATVVGDAAKVKNAHV